MSKNKIVLGTTLFSEITAIDHLFKSILNKKLPDGMEISHFSILNYLSNVDEEKTPAQIAKTFNLTKGAITNTLHKLFQVGYIHIRPDWNDGRKKFINISQTGIKARDQALNNILPLLDEIIDIVNPEKVALILPTLREIRILLNKNK